MADRTEQIILEMEVDTSESVESINALTAANKELRKERNALNLQSEAGKKRAQEINHLIDDNTNKIKTNVSALEKQKINIGNYKSALDGVHPALGKVGEGLQAGTSGFLGMAKAALAFIATPIGAIIAGLVAVFTLLKSALSQNDELMDKFENITNAVGTVVEVLTARLGKLGEALIALAQGDFTGAIDKASEAFSGLGDEIANAVKQQQLFLNASRELEDDTRALNIQIARTENELKKLDKESKNVTLTFEEQEAIVRQALAKQEELVKAKEDLARRDLVITARQLRSAKEFQQQSNETFDQYVQRLLDSAALGDAEKDKIAEKIIALENARGASLDDQAKRENQLAAIQEKRATALAKQNAELEEQARINEALRRSQSGSADTQADDPLVGAFQTQANLIDGIDKRLKEDLAKRDKEFNDEQVKRVEQTAAAKRKSEILGLQVTADVLSAAAGLFEQNTMEYKVLATAQTLIDTFVGAQRSYNALAGIVPAGPVLGAAAAAAAVIAGLGRVAAINNVEFADGGWTGMGSRLEAAGIVHKDEYVTPKWQVHSAAAQPHLLALESQRVRGYADGGLVTNSISQPINQAFDIQNIMKNMPPFEVSVKEITRTQNRIKTKEKISKR